MFFYLMLIPVLFFFCFRVEFLLLPAFVLSILINHDFAVLEVNLIISFYYVGGKSC